MKPFRFKVTHNQKKTKLTSVQRGNEPAADPVLSASPVYLTALEDVLKASKKLCDFIEGDYCEDVWGERDERLELQKLIKIAEKMKQDNTKECGGGSRSHL